MHRGATYWYVATVVNDDVIGSQDTGLNANTANTTNTNNNAASSRRHAAIQRSADAACVDGLPSGRRICPKGAHKVRRERVRQCGAGRVPEAVLVLQREHERPPRVHCALARGHHPCGSRHVRFASLLDLRGLPVDEGLAWQKPNATAYAHMNVTFFAAAADRAQSPSPRVSFLAMGRHSKERQSNFCVEYAW